MPTNHKATIRMQDVALLAGVNIMTVSRVLNHPTQVAERTRKLVLAAIKKTGYVPNLLAGSLATSKSHVVGCIVPTIDNSIFAETVRALEVTLSGKGYQLLLGQSNYDPSREAQLVATFLGRKVDGLVLTDGLHTPSTTKRLKQAKIPVVETWDLPLKPINMVAGFSNFSAGKAVGEYLLSQGHRQLCFAGSDDPRSSARLAGLTVACNAFNKPKQTVSIRVIKLASGASFAGGRQVITTLTQSTMPRALFCGNDALAAGAIMECQRRQIKIPKQLAIMGFADLAIAAHIEPALSTVRVPTAQMGHTAAQLLLAKFDQAFVSKHVVDLGFELLLRASA